MLKFAGCATFILGFQVLQTVLGANEPCRKFDESKDNWKDIIISAELTREHLLGMMKFESGISSHYIAIVCENITDSDAARLATRSLTRFGQSKLQMGVIFARCDFLPLISSTTMEVLHMAFLGCKMKEIPYDLINSARHSLKTLLIYYSSVENKVFSDRGFLQNDRLVHFHIVFTVFESVQRNAFDGFTQLEVLALLFDQIENLHKDAFHGLTRLVILLLGSNSLQSLHKDLFRELTNLKYLDITDNKLTTLSDGIFDSLENITTLKLEGNNLQVDCNLRWLQTWIRDRKAKNKHFKINEITCSNTKELDNLETMTFCTMCGIVSKTIKKDQPRDCPLKQLVGLNMLRKSDDKIMDENIQTYLGMLDMKNLCDKDRCPFKQPFDYEESNNCYVNP